MMRRSPAKGDRLPVAARALNALLLAVVVASMGLPMLNVAAVSFSTRANSQSPGLVLAPVPPSVEGYTFIWEFVDLWRPFFNTVLVAVVGTVLHVLLSSMCGYVLAQPGVPLRNVMTTFVLLTMVIPTELTLVAIYAVNRQFHLVNSYVGLIVNGAVSGFSALLMRGFFLSLPPSLGEAAVMDGCPQFRIFSRIYVPLSIPGVVTIGTLQLISRWNNISMVVTLISDMKKTTLPVMLRWLLFDRASMSGTEFIFANATMAAVVITAVPLIVLYFSAQRFFVTGALVGATKE
jgi:putative aldouronate transport system permease protein